MKWLFIIVALLNIAFASYNLFFSDNTKIKTTQAVSDDKNKIVLLKELDTNRISALQNKLIPTPVAAKDAIISAPLYVAPDIPKTITQPKVEKQMEDIVEPVSDVISAPVNFCHKLGPFTKDMMNDIRLILEEEFQNRVSFGIETTSDITYYRIYIPPLKNKENIKKTLEKLDKNSLKDHYVMSIDGRKNAIALGVFKKRNAAEKVANKATKIGLSTIIEAISDDKNSLYQLLVIFQNSPDIVRYQEIVSQKELISLECKNKG